MDFLYLIARIMRFVRRSALQLWRSITAHPAAGIHPIIVHCSNRQILPRMSRPRNKKDNHGINTAIRVITNKYPYKIKEFIATVKANKLLKIAAPQKPSYPDDNNKLNLQRIMQVAHF
jgi:hypothetical protein